jgi:MoxR-like ATPase
MKSTGPPAHPIGTSRSHGRKTSYHRWRSAPVHQPFFVIATQNPIEYQGTFPLPEAQMDRFAVCLSLGYPSATEELKMLQRQHSQETVKSLEACISLEQVGELQRLVSLVKVAPTLQQYIVDLVRATR